jgi:hypothetical protein
MKWYLIVQFLANGHYVTIEAFPTEKACQEAETRAKSLHIIGMRADPMSLSYCIAQRAGENRFPTSRDEGEYLQGAGRGLH